MNTCQSCIHSDKSNTYAIGCYRTKTMKSGFKWKATPGVGFPVDFETGHIDIYEGRVDADHCGPERRHWKARA
jgi:hypothetical protein